MYKKLTFRLEGVVPLIMNNGQSQNPDLKINKERSKLHKRGHKTEQDELDGRKLDFLAALYTDDKGHPVIPGDNFDAMMYGRSGAVSQMKVKGISRKKCAANIFTEGPVLLEYDGPSTAKELAEDERFRFFHKVVRSNISVFVTHPIFPKWSATVAVKYNSDQLDADDVAKLMVYGGENVGVCDWRPKYGRFVATLVE